MADRKSVSITLGGMITANQYAQLLKLIAVERLTMGWDAEAFSPDDRVVGQPLTLYAKRVADGRFSVLESWCVANKVPFIKTSWAFSDQRGPKRVIFIGSGKPETYYVDVYDHLVIDLSDVLRLGSFEAITGYFKQGYSPMPPLVVEGDSLPVSAELTKPV